MSVDSTGHKLASWRAMHADTDPWAEKMQLDFYRTAPAWRKLELAGDLTKGMLLFAESGLIGRYPQASPVEIRRRLAVCFLVHNWLKVFMDH